MFVGEPTIKEYRDISLVDVLKEYLLFKVHSMRNKTHATKMCIRKNCAVPRCISMASKTTRQTAQMLYTTVSGRPDKICGSKKKESPFPKRYGMNVMSTTVKCVRNDQKIINPK